MVVVVVSPSKRSLFECREDLSVREIFTSKSFSENVFSNGLPALHTEVLRDSGASAGFVSCSQIACLALFLFRLPKTGGLIPVCKKKRVS